MRGALILVSLVALLAGACSGGSETDTRESSEGAARAEASPQEAERAPTADQPDAARVDEPATQTPTTTSPEPEAPASTPPATDPKEQRADEEAVAVVREWSASLNAGNNDAAGELFAPDAIVIQGPNVISLPDAVAASRFTASLPCSGEIVDVRVANNVVTAVFELGDRPTSRCDAAPGSLAAADFLIEDGRIVIWELVPVPDTRQRTGAV